MLVLEEVEISKDLYEALSQMPSKDLTDWLDDKIPICVHRGYGCYGKGICEKGDKYYYWYKRGSSCD